MGVLRFMVRLAFVAYICLGAYQDLQDTKTAASELLGHYHSFELGFTKLTGWKYHEKLKSSFWKNHAEDVVTYLSYAKFGFGLLALTLCSLSTAILGLLYFVHQVMAKNFLELRPQSPLEQKREAVLVTFVFLSSLLLSCDGKRSCLGSTSSDSSRTERTKQKRRN